MNNDKVKMSERIKGPWRSPGMSKKAVWRQRAFGVVFSFAAGGKRIYFGNISKWVITTLRSGGGGGDGRLDLSRWRPLDSKLRSSSSEHRNGKSLELPGGAKS